MSKLSIWKHSPMSHWNELTREMDRFFEDLTDYRSAPETAMAFSPGFDLEEQDSHFMIGIDLPGLKREEINIDVDNDTLRISGERKREETEETKQGTYFSRRSFGHFEKSFRLPANVDADQIEAHYENGVLSIALPKSEKAKGRKVEITSNKEGFFDRFLGSHKKSGPRKVVAS